jgi:hypothetical protein
MADRPKQIWAANDPQCYVLVDARDWAGLLGIKCQRKRAGWQHFRRGKQRLAKATREWNAYRSGHFYSGTLPDKVVWLHREVAACPTGKYVGFKDGDQRNCRRSNLVVCDTKAQADSYKHAALERAASGKA